MTIAGSSADLPREYDGILRRLDEAGNQFRLAYAVGGVARFLCLVVPITLAIIIFAGLVNLPAWIHWVLILALPLTAGIGYGLFLHEIIFRRPSHGQIARWVEEQAQFKKLPLENRLINAVLLADELQRLRENSDDSLTGSNKNLIPRVLKEIHSDLAEQNFTSIIPWHNQRRPWFAAAAVLLMCTILIVLFSGSLAHGLAVLSSPDTFVPRQGIAQILAVQPGDETVLAGQSVDFMVRIKTPGAELIPVDLRVKFKSGASADYSMLPFGTTNDSFRYTLESAAEDATYMISAGGTESQLYHITVLPEITLQSYQIDVAPPPYTNLPGRKIVLPGKNLSAEAGSLSVPQGSKVSLAAMLSQAVIGSSAILEFSASNTLPINSQDGQTFRTILTIGQTTSFDWLIDDASGRALQHFPVSDDTGNQQFTIQSITDEPPTVSVLVPNQNINATPGAGIPLEAAATDDYGLTDMALQVAVDNSSFSIFKNWPIGNAANGKPATTADIKVLLPLSANQYHAGQTIKYRFTATDNRQINLDDQVLGPQTTFGTVYTIQIQNTPVADAQHADWIRLEEILQDMLQRQTVLINQSSPLANPMNIADIHSLADALRNGQSALLALMQNTVKTFPFTDEMSVVRQALSVLCTGDAGEAVARADDLVLISDSAAASVPAEQLHENQINVLNALKALLALADTHASPTASLVSQEGSNFPTSPQDEWKKLQLALQQMEKQQRDVISTSLRLAQKPLSDYDANDKNDLLKAQAIADQWSKFLNQALVNMSNLTEQNQSDASLKDDLAQMNIELAMEANALNMKAVTVATPLEENGLEDAQTLDTHIEQWLMQHPDTTKWEMENPVAQNDVPAPPLPAQLQNMIGQLLQNEEDLTNDMESLGSRWNDSINKGNGWGAGDGPISDMSAQGVTGNNMPKNDEIQGRSGEGREGRASGEMVGATAVGQGGVRTPTRMTGDQFSSGQINDTSNQPPGGATGGGKQSGYGGQGLEGPAPQEMDNDIKRMAGIQAQLLDQTNRLKIELQASGYNNFKLIEAAVLMQDAEHAMNAYQYQTAMLYQKMADQDLNTAQVLAGAAARVSVDNPEQTEKIINKLSDTDIGDLPNGYADPVKAYFLKLSQSGN
ncbi:MAG TPA: hypothetical protein VMG59_06240 [Phycisphaerae bacterium]|nr:hypothetical protein [Phycisphaerae bacterium]